jgi:hypothetical protein
VNKNAQAQPFLIHVKHPFAVMARIPYKPLTLGVHDKIEVFKRNVVNNVELKSGE